MSMNGWKKAAGTGSSYKDAVRPRTQNGSLYLAAKRSMDVCLSVMGLIYLIPLFVVLALLIKLEDPRGSVFFSQTRIGKDGKPFRMYKFRSMITNAEEMLKDLLDKNEVGGAMFKMRSDPRITRIGGFLRKTSIDELPQLWNVIRGDMSLVGPRPPLPREVDEYTLYDLQRLQVTPGCTGLWQISGRNDVSFEEMVEMDLQYIRERSLMKDIQIMIKTVGVLFKSKGAY